MKKLHFFSVIIFLILWAHCLLAQENPDIGQSDLEIEKLTRQKEYLRTRIYEIVRENKFLEEKIKLFENKANAYDEVVAKDQKTISELKVAYDQLENDMKTLQKENNSLLNSLEDKESFIQNVQEKLEKDMLAQKDQLLAELERKNQNLSAAGNQLKESREAVHIHEQEDAIRKETGISEEQNKQITLKNDDFNQAVDELSRENKDLEKQNADLMAHENEKEDNIAQLSKNKESLAVELATQKDKYSILEKKFDQLAQSGDRLTEGLDTLKARNQDLETQNTALMTDKKSKEVLISELNKNKESLMKELASFSERYKTLDEKFSRISQSAIKNDEWIVKEVEKARKPLEELNSSLEKRVAELTAIVEKEGKSISELVEKKRDTDVVNRSLTNENKKINEKLVSLETQLKSAQESFDVKITELKTPLDGKILFLEEKLKKADANDAVISQLSKEKNQVQADLKSLQNENKKLKSDLVAANELLHETDGFLVRKVDEAVIKKDAEIKQLREKLGMTKEESETSDDVSLKGKEIKL